MSLVTYFRANVRCGTCGREVLAWIPSKLGSKGATYKVGDCPGPDIPPADIEDACFLVRAPRDGEPVHVLESFTCEEDRSETFAELVLADGCVQSIAAVVLDVDVLARLHYIDESLYDMIESIMGVPIYTGSGPRPDWLDILRRALASGRRWGQDLSLPNVALEPSR